MKELAKTFAAFAERNDVRLAELARKQDICDLDPAELDELSFRMEKQFQLFKFKRARLGLETPDFL